MRCVQVFVITALILVHSASAQEGNWRLVWQDDFNGNQLDFNQWEIEINAFGGGNQELQIYTDRKENVRVEGGNLILEAHRGRTGISGTERDYSSGRIRSKRRGDWTYCRVEIRAQLPPGQGIWPAFWMLPTEEKYGGWAASGEIDIMEFKGQEPHRVHGTLHYGGGWPKNKYSGKPFELKQGNFTDSFHTFALEWEPKVIRWYVDGELYQTQTEWNSVGGTYPAPFDQAFHLVFNVAVGGGFVGNPNKETPFPATLKVDWVKVYQR